LVVAVKGGSKGGRGWAYAHPQLPKIFLTSCKAASVEDKDEKDEHEELDPYKPRDSVAFYCKLIPKSTIFQIYDFRR
jgi:hypothetical protein